MASVCETPAYKAAVDRVVEWLSLQDDICEALKGKSILVTGATGQLGAALTCVIASLNDARELGMTVVAASRNRESFVQKLGFLGEGAVSFKRFEATEPFSYEDGIDYIAHCAGYGDPSAFVNDPVGVMKCNIFGLDTLLAFLARQGSGRLLFVSSGEVYGQGDPDVESFVEEYCGSIDSTKPRSCYPLAKRAGEALCASYKAQYGVESVIARQCHVYGPGYSQRDSRVTAMFLNCARTGKRIVMSSEGKQVRSYLFELDAACAYVVMLARGVVGEAYNVAPTQTMSIRELGEAVARSAGIELVIEVDQSASAKGYGGITRSVLCPTKLQGLGWQACFDGDEGVQSTIECLISGGRGDGRL